MPLAPWRGRRPAVITRCSSPRCPHRSAGSRCWLSSTNASAAVRAASRGSVARRSDVALIDFRLVGGLPVWRYALDGHRHREAAVHAARAQLDCRHLQAAQGATGPARAAPDGQRAHARSAGRSHRSAGARRVGAPRLARRDRRRRRAHDPARGPRPRGRVHRGHRSAKICTTSSKSSAGIQPTAGTWSPGYYKLDLAEHEQVTFIGSTETPASLDALSPDEPWATELERRTRLLVAAGSPPPDSLTAELVLAADQFVIKPATRTARRGARAGGWREHAQHHRRLPLVHRLGPRHDDQPRRPHAVHRPRTRKRAIRC